MVQKMLIDASHPEETRVAVVDGNKLEDFDYETQAKKQLRGNIYLAKVTRVEPSLQAAFIEYGGNRHGFLAFNEIHPDYYQIPYEDRQRLLQEEEREARAAEEEDDRAAEAARKAAKPAKIEDDSESASADAHEDTAEDGGQDVAGDSAEDAAEAGDEAGDEAGADEAETAAADTGEAPVDGAAQAASGADDHEDDAALMAEQAAKRRRRAMRNYKIQEVIKRRQILLVQVVKEERGNKGAALTTYLSLAGRYCVLMPNTHRGGGISRKISDNADRRRLKEVVDSLNLAEGMGVIIRTAGFSRTKAEIKRDYEYLLRLWERIREETLKSSAPSLIYEEGNLIKRAIRDLYEKEFDSILVEGDEAYRQAKDFMRVLIPSHAKKVQPYKDRTPLFMRMGVEHQIEQIYQPVVQLKSGGYLVINQTEALVAIDVNSGRSTRERNIEATALKTNLEAADEACRQMRLRDLAGLIVIDFIDMEENKNNRAVEKRLRDALKVDRARIQVGKISQFGLLEMSRQRRRSSVFEGSNETCPHCNGTGFVRSDRSASLQVLRALEEEALKRRSALVRVKAPSSVALYLLNEKRADLQMFEDSFGMRAHIEVDPGLTPPDFKLERLEALNAPPAGGRDEDHAADDHAEAPAEERDESGGDRPREERSGERSGERGERGGKRRRRRRGRRSGGEGSGGTESGGARESASGGDYDESDDRDGDEAAGDDRGDDRGGDDGAREDGGDQNGSDQDSDTQGGDRAPRETGEETGEDGQPKRRRRGRRGGRGRKRREGGEAGADAASGADNGDGDHDAGDSGSAGESADADDTANADATAAIGAEQAAAEDAAETAAPAEGMEVVEPQADDTLTATETAKKPRARKPRKRAAKKSAPADAAEDAAPDADAETQPEPVADAAPEQEPAPEPETAAEAAPEPEPEPQPEPAADAAPKPVKRGWWQKRTG